MVRVASPDTPQDAYVTGTRHCPQLRLFHCPLRINAVEKKSDWSLFIFARSSYKGVGGQIESRPVM